MHLLDAAVVGGFHESRRSSHDIRHQTRTRSLPVARSTLSILKKRICNETSVPASEVYCASASFVLHERGGAAIS